MRFATVFRYVAACIILLASFACGATPTEPAPVYELKTETFSGSLNTGGSAGFPFAVVNPGNINVSITQLTPVSSVTMGLSLGSWDATTEVCSEELTTSATFNVVYTGSPAGPGNYCVMIFDSGNVQVATEFTLTVTHY